jgi:hypothetical protein
MADLLRHFGNPVHHAGERLKAAHQPVHGSRSGACVVVWPTAGRWWCSSCRTSGDAVIFVMQALGLAHPAAAAWLAERYGPPSDAGTELSRRRASRAKRRPYNASWRRVVVGGGSSA